MAIKITWADFDKTLFVTPKNIRKLMGFSITFGDEQEKIENKVNDVEKIATDAQEKAEAADSTSQSNNTQILQLNRDVSNLQTQVTGHDTTIWALNQDYQDLERRVRALEGG